jgi:hypothetical protein
MAKRKGLTSAAEGETLSSVCDIGPCFGTRTATRWLPLICSITRMSSSMLTRSSAPAQRSDAERTPHSESPLSGRQPAHAEFR